MDLVSRTIFPFQIVLGILGNFSCLCEHLFNHLSGRKARRTDLVVRHLTVANALVILSRGVPETIAAFGHKHFLGDLGCKLVFYVHRVARGVSISTTCLLTAFQAIIISPMDSRWAELKAKSPKFIRSFSVLSWVLHMLINIQVPVVMSGGRSNKNTTFTVDFGYCSAAAGNKGVDSALATLVTFHDVLWFALMLCTSGSMVFILHQHKKRVQHIHRRKVLPRSSPEIQATQRILVLVSTFGSLYSFSSVIYFYFYFFDETAGWLLNTSALVNACFPTASPFILMSYSCTHELHMFMPGRNKPSSQFRRTQTV
ncbi:vomeronasal type-1 receptor 2-like [Ochotona curzoniae]|uniref:vomeronasal type-1 receptor 2-like n=1 Tax=Ochotona curzoniae TaxID=130825 RepID=UPI001B346108|nr:vomeronasal type-1 receptor 2-like [Ochotona curzoniae]